MRSLRLNGAKMSTVAKGEVSLEDWQLNGDTEGHDPKSRPYNVRCTGSAR